MPGEDIAVLYPHNKMALTGVSFSTADAAVCSALIIQSDKNKGKSITREALISQLKGDLEMNRPFDLGYIVIIVAMILRILLNILVIIFIILAIINWLRKRQGETGISLKILVIATLIVFILNIAVFILAGLLLSSSTSIM